MISLEKWMISAPLQKLPKNVEDLRKLIVTKGFKKLPKVQKIAYSGHTGYSLDNTHFIKEKNYGWTPVANLIKPLRS